MQFNLADVFETVADAVPDRVALTYEGENLSYAQLDAEANRTAQLLTQAGISRGNHVALFLKNSVEHVASILGLLKIRAVPINVNYRYTPAELEYIFVNSDSAAVVVEISEHQRVLASLLDACPMIRTVIVVGEIAAELLSAANEHAVSVVSLADARELSPTAEFDSRTGDDLYLLYTGGTTGYPKGVMWRQDDFFRKPLSGGNPYGEGARENLAEIASAAKQFPELSFLIAAPLMHGAALYSLFTFFTLGARVVLRRDFDPRKVVESIEKDSVQVILIVGDAMGLPLVDEMERRKGEVDLSSLFSITSGGAIWSTSVRDRMLAVKPDLLLRDNFGASESGNDGAFTIDEVGTLRMPPSPSMTLVDESLNEIAAGSEEVGYIARIGNVPLGYYKDEEKTARTFPTRSDGTRLSVLGDMGKVEADGTIVFLGRGSQCINTGGEKVFAEEVEAALHAHPSISDALVVAAPDQRMGQRVAAVIATYPESPELTLDDVQEHCRKTLAGYKIPRSIVLVEEVKRTPAGKADYRWAATVATDVS
ncbi:acyl-CoA synthetase [Rhodococcus sp. PAMC28707]|uniref:AMP-binding protein n=1 Tax=unclassified Rhodococcus (in: high G+C Gram-positive bacteria) TaxID=192944 RepID=UPI00109DE043|nr:MULTISPECIES: AMP-binding protein [unclassified Rhodococcus (in: high G+C Gram-positive bacteria)]QCB49655.1 acyl-CoA synthetase [Rhodococcus sp. PAMC28705]QCB58654.1 acyl-CoA synthetase [Rhodococcus sp. PAMC28707]